MQAVKKPTMRAWAIGGYGDPMQLMDLPVPEPGPNDILIRMHGAEIGDWDEAVRTGEWDMERPFPLVLGLAGAGAAAAVGADVTGFAENDPVYAYSYPLYDNGAWAEYMLVPGSYVARVPASLDPMHAGALPIAGLTAYGALLDILAIAEGDILVITAASGGVGHLAVQIAARAGAFVIGVTSGRNRQFVSELGAHEVIDYTAADDVAKLIRAEYPKGVDKILNGVSGDIANEYVWALRDGGKMVDLPGTVDVERPGVDVVTDYVVRGDGMRLRVLSQMIDDGLLRLAIHDAVPFVRAPEALDMVLTKHVRGKVVLEI